MKLGCLVFFILAVTSARGRSVDTIKNENIPVAVVYDGKKNAEEKIQVTDKEETITSGVKNLQERVQLSPEELAQALKHLPETEEIKIGLRDAAEPEKIESSTSIPPLSLIRKIEEIIYAGLCSIRKNIESSAEISKPTDEEWKSFNKTIETLISEEYKNSGSKQQPPSSENNQNNIIQTIVTGFQNAAQNWVQGFQNNGNNQNKPEDEQGGGGGTGQQTGFWQNFVSQFQGGINQVVNNIQNLSGQPGASNSTVLGDTGVPPPSNPQNFFSNVISSVQQIFTGQNNQQSAPGNNQSDTGTGNQGGQNIFQGAINQFSQVVGSFRPTSAPPASGQGDEGSTPSTGPIGGFIQTVQNQIGSAITQVQNFGQSTSKPSGSEDETTSSTQATNIIQSIGQAIQSVNPFRPQGAGGSQGGATNPIQSGAQAVNNQIQQLVGSQAGGNPVEGIQNAVGNFTAGLPGVSTDKSKTQEEVKPVEETIKPEKVKEKADEIMQTME